MKILNSKAKWREYFKSTGLEDEQASIYLKYIERLLSKRLPIIFNISHLTQLIGIEKNFLLSMLYASEKHYRTFNLAKKSGGSRKIDAPLPTLLYCQQWINKNILNHLVSHDCTYAYRRDKNIVLNAQQHLNKKILYKLDIKDFFPSINYDRVFSFYQYLGYNKEVSFALAKLSTFENKLPQGAATSANLSNHLFYIFDKRISKLSKKFSIVYTRYADDLIFSGDKISHLFIAIIKKIINENKLEINTSKTKLYTTRSRRIITGIDISNGHPRIPREYRRKIRKEILLIQKLGIFGFLEHENISDYKYISSLIGKINYWIQVEPNNLFAKSSLDMMKSKINS
ncbi:reverse transcriptase family protein [Leptospira terpstrae]|uniref:reverse transcriptase family protein n=1 Tax=Leptospira terpstrae TaxID=293075 RepID=UPI003D056825